MKLAGFAAVVFGFACMAEPANADGTPWLPGVNLAAGEFNGGRTRLWTDYAYPSGNEINYFANKGFRLFRIPFLSSRVLNEQNEPTPDLRVLQELARNARARGGTVVLDMHEYGGNAVGLIGRDAGALELFASRWKRLAVAFADQANVMFGLMNEPNRQSATEWLKGANAAIAAIRSTGAKQTILVPGSYWDGAHSWVSSDNGSVMLGVQDPANNYAYEVHQYLDADNSGTHREVVKGAGGERLKAFTAWARANRKRAMLGEFGWADSPEAHAEGDALVSYMSANRDVWLGWTYWAAGPWWGEYMFTLEPKNGVDRPQMRVLEPYLK